MAITANSITRRKLVLVKQLYQHGVIQASHFGAPSQIIALISFDLASESLLRALVGSFDASKTPAEGFPGLIQQVESLLSTHGLGPLPDRANVLHVHSLRNDAQHKAKYPNETDVNDARTYIRDFLQKFCLMAWNLDFERTSLTDLVQYPRVKQYLCDAEAALAASDFENTVAHAATGLFFVLDSVKSAVVGRLPSFSKFVMVDTFGKPVRADGFDDPSRALERMQETLLYVALGLNYGDYVKIRHIAPVVHFTVGGSVILQRTTSKTPTKSEAEFVVASATDAVLQIESRVGDIEKPFGSDRWF